MLWVSRNPVQQSGLCVTPSLSDIETAVGSAVSPHSGTSDTSWDSGSPQKSKARRRKDRKARVKNERKTRKPEE